MGIKTQPWFGAARRLSERSADSYGLTVDEDGVTLGPDLALIRKTSRGYETATVEELSCLREVVSLRAADAERLARHLESIAKALNAGDLARARILGLYFPVNRLTRGQVERLRNASAVLKGSFNPDEPRDERGRWTTGGATAPSSSVASRFHPSAETGARRPFATRPGVMRVQEFLAVDPKLIPKTIIEEFPSQEGLPRIGEVPSPTEDVSPPSPAEKVPPPTKDEPEPIDRVPFVPSRRSPKGLTYERCMRDTVSPTVWLGVCAELAKDPKFELDPRLPELLRSCRRAALQSVQYKKNICGYIFWEDMANAE